MSGWAAYLPPDEPCYDGCAIISMQGALCSHKGNWTATPAEMQSWFVLIQQPKQAAEKGVSYGGKRLFVARQDSTSLNCTRENTALIISKTKTVMFACVVTSAHSAKKTDLAVFATKYTDMLTNAGI